MSGITVDFRVKLTEKQKHWLNSKGGRNENDVEIDDDGEFYIWMGNGRNKQKPVYLPVDKVD